MSLIRELHRRARRAAVPIFGVFAVFYFGYHTFVGQYGLMGLHRLNRQIEILERDAGALAARRAALEQQVAQLRPDSLDADALDEAVRRTLGFVHPDELVIPLGPPGVPRD